jgi:hypothetical protein
MAVNARSLTEGEAAPPIHSPEDESQELQDRYLRNRASKLTCGLSVKCR